MFVSEEEAELRLSSEDNLANKIRIKDLHSNRNGPRNIPPMVQTLAVALGQVTTQESAAQAFDMTAENLSYLTREGKKVDRNIVKEKVESVHLHAIEAMVESIATLRPKLKDVKKATDLSKIASDMANVVNKTAPQQANATNIMVVAYAPRMKDESEFEEVVVVNQAQ